MTARLHVVGSEPSPFRPFLLPAPLRYLPGEPTPLTELAAHTLREHHTAYGPLPAVADALELVDDAVVTGRGGAHVPAELKWRALRAEGTTTVVANGAEGEPLSRKDAALLEFRPHLVLDGLLATMSALEATRAVVWLHDDAHAARSAVTRALAERHDAAAVSVQVGPAHYLTGESSAVASAVTGGTPSRPVFVRPRGVLVHNVETLARIALAVRGEAPDTALVSVSAGHAISVLEVPAHLSAAAAVSAVLGAGRRPLLVGGFGGTWVDADTAEQLELHGAALGAGVLHALPHGVCGVRRAAEVAEELAASSAGQCGPCVFGLRALADSMAALAGTRRSRRERERLTGFVAEIRGRGACHHPDGAARMVASALEVFADDVAAHLRGRCLDG